MREERKGPRVGAPEKAVEGFLKSAGLASLDEARIEKDPKKGEFYVAAIERPGRPTPEAWPRSCPPSSATFRGRNRCAGAPPRPSPARLRWVRPLHAIVCTFGPETEAPEIVPFAVDGIRAGDVTQRPPLHGRRRRSRCGALPITPRRSSGRRSCSTPERRKDIILDEAKNLAFASGLELVEDEALLEEVAGLVEWPVVLMGAFDEAFLDIPPEVIRATIRANQKCFVLRASPSPLAGEGRARASARVGRGVSSSHVTRAPLPPRLRSAPSPARGEARRSRTASSWSRTSRPRTAGRRSSPATSA